MSELSRDDSVRELIDSLNQVGSTTADRLQAGGLKTVGDITDATPDDLIAFDGVGGRRAERVHAAAEDIVGVVPRDVDFDATKSVVSEAAIPLSVRRGEAVLVGNGSDHVYHTRACANVTSDRSTKLKERSLDWVDRSEYRECKLCADPNTHAEHGKQAATSAEPDPLIDSREVALDATLGEKLTLTMADRTGYANAWAVIDTAEPTTWETPTGETWQTRRIRISQRMDGSETHRECDLVVAADEIRLEDPPVKGRAGYAATESWRVESVGAVGRVSQSVFVRLQGRLEDQEARPEGDDSWRQYHRGETA